ncbi:hypothetical protein RND71_007189 [Anisodus tanguticus]|uniref:Uncharacterized protein n=1 Tax=Anisodus tanguticus TaxID=243964 RepID=A0AAE1SKX4_9SOLA|nr:hypothetical protein RND71_007189 [Anisodus tanguticus]
MLHCLRQLSLTAKTKLSPPTLEDLDSLSQAQYDLAFDIFLQFDSLANHHFPRRETYNFNNMLDCSFHLKNQLELHLHKSRSKVKLLCRATRGSAVCLVAATVGVVISAVIIATHGLAALSCNGTIRFGLESGRDRYHIQEALKQLRRKHSVFLDELVSLEEHLCVCFTAISTARDHLLNYLCRQNQAPR